MRNFGRIGTIGIVLPAIWAIQCMLPVAGAAQPPILPAPAEMTLSGNFAGKGNGAAKDISGIACQPPDGDGARNCIVVNDENRSAQRATLRAGTLTPGAMVPLIGTAPPSQALGSAPVVTTCPGGDDGFGEFDGEGVAFAPASGADRPAFLVVGSHGCSRTKNEFRASSFLLARVQIDASGALRPAELTWRLSEVLRGHAGLRDHFARPLNASAPGLNIEGIAASGDNLLIGLRAPSVEGNGLVVVTSIAAMFAQGNAPIPPARVFTVALGRNAGIRDMTTLPDGRLLVLSGPTLEQADVPFAISLVDLPGPGADAPAALPVRLLARLADITDGGERVKAEAIAVTGRSGNSLELLVLFDGLRNGGPRTYRIDF